MAKASFGRDWFNRRKEDAYTYVDETRKAFDWESGRTNYSSYFVRNTDTMQNAAKMVGSMFRVIGVPKDTKFTSSNVKGSLNIPLHMLKDEEGKWSEPDGAKLDAFYGACIQNAALKSFQSSSEYNATQAVVNKDKGRFSAKDYFTAILNTERIDRKLATRLPGYNKFVQKYKNHAYEENYEPLDPSEDEQKRLLDLVTRMLRFPATVTEEELVEFKEPLKKVERLLKKYGGIPENFSDVQSMSTSIANIVYTHEPPEMEESPKGGEGDDDSDSDDEDSEGLGGSDEEGPKSGKMSKSDINDFAKDMMDKLMPSMSGDDGESSEDDKEVLDDFVEDMQESKSLSKFDPEKVNEGSTIDGNKILFRKSGTDKDTYLRAMSKVDTTKAAVLQKLFMRKNKDYQFAMKSMRSGRLDTNKIAEAVQRVPTVYERYGQVTTDKICVTVLIDESGSMSGSKITKAREAAIFINEVFKKIPNVELFIYGHTADQGGMHCTNVIIYKEPGYNEIYALGNVDARSNNRDGDAILATAKRVRNFTKNNGLMFVLSDGQPSAYDYGGHSAIVDTRKKVTMAQNLGFQVIQIAIEESVPSSQMFDYFIKMTNIKNLPKDLIGYMSRKVDKLIKERVLM